MNLIIIIFATIEIFSGTISGLLLSIGLFILIPSFNLYVFIKIINKRKNNNFLKSEKIITTISLFFNIPLFLFLLFLSIYNWKDIIYRFEYVYIIILIYIIACALLLYNIYKSNIYKKNTYKILIKKILKVLKWIFIVFIVGFIILIITIYISSLNSYKKSDFNIPKDFFNTKYYDKDPLSKDNGFKDLVIFKEGLVKEKDAKDINGNYLNINRNEYRISKNNYLDKDINLKYFDTLSKCIFKDTNANKDKCKKLEENKDIEKKFQKFKDFVLSNTKKLEEINNKKFILQTPEYSGINGRVIIWTNFIQYSRAIRYMAYRYFEEGKYEKGIQVLLKYQKFIDNLINKGDGSLIYGLVLITINNININTINYFIDNYELDNNLKNKIYSILNNKINGGLIENNSKFEHIYNRKFFKNLWKDIMLKEEGTSYFSYYKGIIESYLFYSVKESELISDVYMYNNIKNRGVNVNNFNCKININNYIGRYMACNINFPYESQFKKEEKMHKLRNDILEKLKKSIEKEKTLSGKNVDKKVLGNENLNNSSKKNVSDKNLHNVKNSDNKDLGNGFELKFNLNTTQLLYKNKTKASFDTIDRIESLEKGIFILFHGNKGNDGGVVFFDKITGNQKMLFRNTDYETTDNKYLEIINFAVNKNSDVHIVYKGKDLERKIKIIKSKDL